MSSDLSTDHKLSTLKTLIITAKDDITHTREAYSHDGLGIELWLSVKIRNISPRPTTIYHPPVPPVERVRFPLQTVTLNT